MRQSDEVTALHELLNLEYALDPGALSAAAEILAVEIDEREKSLFRLINQPWTTKGCENLVEVLRYTLEGRPRIANVLRRACKKKGRVDCCRRCDVLRALSPRTPPAPTRPKRSVKRRRDSFQLTLDPSSTSFQSMPTLISSLSGIDPEQTSLEIVIDEFVYASGLAVVATWCARSPDRRKIVFGNPYSERYCNRIGFLDAVEGVSHLPEPDDEDFAVRLTPILRDRRTEDTTDKMLEILDTFINPNKEERSSLGILLGEIIENVERHAMASSPGYVVAQVYPKKLKLGITIADSGIGIAQSFLNGEDVKYRREEWRTAEFIRQALSPLVTSKPSRHSGYGLYLLSELVTRNRGSFIVSSGDCSTVGYRSEGAIQLRGHHQEFWQGTIVSMIIDLQRSLPIIDVYNSLPIPAGYTADDFFD